MKIIRSVVAMQQLSDAWRRRGISIGFVPTMGALHEGHLRLVRHARKSAKKVVVSLFVNPIQFGPKEDYRKYPRPFAADARLLAREKVDVLFAPSVRQMFPEKFATRVHVEGISENLCGAFRPGHFDGVATVVAKLFGIVRPDVAFFGLKDYQQCKVVERMTANLNLGVRIRTVPTVRESDGLAMSSRNAYLTAAQRNQAAGIFLALKTARRAAKEGIKKAGVLRNGAIRELKKRGLSRIDYVEIVDGETLKPLRLLRRPAVMAIALHLGSARLIDNMRLL